MAEKGVTEGTQRPEEMLAHHCQTPLAFAEVDHPTVGAILKTKKSKRKRKNGKERTPEPSHCLWLAAYKDEDVFQRKLKDSNVVVLTARKFQQGAVLGLVYIRFRQPRRWEELPELARTGHMAFSRKRDLFKKLLEELKGMELVVCPDKCWEKKALTKYARRLFGPSVTVVEGEYVRIGSERVRFILCLNFVL